MDEREIHRALIKLVRYTLNGQDISVGQEFSEEILESVYSLAKKHDISHILSGHVCNSKAEVPSTLKAKFQHDEFVSIYRCEQLKYAFGEICEAFNHANIPYIPLKGSVIRPYYPYESMRTSCDIDILVHEEDVETAIESLVSKGYSCGDRNYHDVSLFSPGKIHLELHFNIKENMENLDRVLKDAWAHARLSEGSKYLFEKEFFVFHMYAHMAYHFLSGGCGIKTLIDIWVMTHKMDAPYTCAKELLEKAGIYTFASEMSRLSEKCFSEDTDVFSDPVLEYIFKGGVYGTKENNIAVKKEKSNGSFVYVLKRLFLPYNNMIMAYPILKKAPILLPILWVVRWIKAIIGKKTDKIASEMSTVVGISNDRTEQIKMIRKRLQI